MTLTNIQKGKIVIMKEAGYSLKYISEVTGIPYKIIREYWKLYSNGYR